MGLSSPLSLVTLVLYGSFALQDVNCELVAV